MPVANWASCREHRTREKKILYGRRCSIFHSPGIYWIKGGIVFITNAEGVVVIVIICVVLARLFLAFYIIYAIWRHAFSNLQLSLSLCKPTNNSQDLIQISSMILTSSKGWSLQTRTSSHSGHNFVRQSGRFSLSTRANFHRPSSSFASKKFINIK